MLRPIVLLAATTWLISPNMRAEERSSPQFPPIAEARLGTALSLSPRELESHVAEPRVARGWAPGTEGAITGLAVDTAKRDEVVAFFHCIYTPSQDFASHHGWTGDLASCSAGTVSQELHDDTRRRINYYRAMAGLNGDISFAPDKNADCQEAALIMARNRSLSHFPPTSWDCYTAGGYTAAGASNLSLGFNFANYGVGAVDGQMEDDGSNNQPVGHRRWLLYSRAKEMGHGSIPLTPTNDACAAAIWTIGNFNPAPPAGLDKIAWPPEGYVPHQTVWARWSFGLPNGSASFSSATVTMSRDGASLPVTIIHRGSGSIGDPTIVWEPGGANYPDFPAEVPSSDTTFTVTVSGITGNGQSSYSYDVTVINPADPGDLSLNGPANPPANTATTYHFTPLENATSYQTSASKVVPATWTEGAENGTMNAIVDLTTSGLTLQANSPKRTGSSSFHLAFDGVSDQGFEVCRPIIPSATSRLEFYNLRRWATTTSVLFAEVSADGGATWDELWNRAGNGSQSSADWDSSFQSVSADLSAYAGQVVKLRFVYRYLGGFFFSGTGSGNGFYLDDITVTGSKTFGTEWTETLPAGSSSFTFTPDAPAEDYYIRIRPIFACEEFGFADALAVTSSAGLPGTLQLVQVAEAGAMLEFRFVVANGAFSTLTLKRSSDLTNWSDDPSATLLDHGGGSYTFQATPPAGWDQAYYRVSGQ